MCLLLYFEIDMPQPQVVFTEKARRIARAYGQPELDIALTGVIGGLKTKGAEIETLTTYLDAFEGLYLQQDRQGEYVVDGQDKKTFRREHQLRGDYPADSHEPEPEFPQPTLAQVEGDHIINGLKAVLEELERRGIMYTGKN